MERIPFDIRYRREIEAGKLLVVTRTGAPVEIIKWDCGYEYPICAIINGVGEGQSVTFTKKGAFCSDLTSPNDLFLVLNPSLIYKKSSNFLCRLLSLFWKRGEK